MTGDEGEGTDASERGFNFAVAGTTAYLLVCCVILPAAFGSAVLSAGSLWFGAPEWVVIGLGGISVALVLWYIGERI